MTVDDADNADTGRIQLEIDRVWKSMEQHATQSAAYDRELFRRLDDPFHDDVELGKKVCRRVRGSGEIPIERLRYLGASLRPDAEDGHLANPGPQLVAQGSPRNASVGFGIGFRFAAVEIGGEGRSERRGGRRIKTVPETADQRDALFGGEGFQGLRPFNHRSRMPRMSIGRNACPRGHNEDVG